MHDLLKIAYSFLLVIQPRVIFSSDVYISKNFSLGFPGFKELQSSPVIVTRDKSDNHGNEKVRGRQTTSYY